MKDMGIREVLIWRDEMSPDEADELIEEARADLRQRLEVGEMPFDICAEWFGLEEDYLMELL